MPLKLSLITGPAAEPITLTEAKAHLRVDDAAEDTYIGTLIAAARAYAERVQGRAYINQTWRLVLDGGFPSREIQLPYAPLSSVTSITYLDTAGESTTLATTEYTVDTASQPGRVYPVYAKLWPTTRNVEQAVTITYVAGYGSAGSSVPDTVKHALKLLVGHWFANREPVVVGARAMSVPTTVEALLGVDRVYSFGE